MKLIYFPPINSACLSKKRQAGFTALEISIVLIIVLLLIVFVGGNIQKLFGSSEITMESSNIQELQAAIRTNRPKEGYGTTTPIVETLDKIKALPASMNFASGKLTNAWNGEVTVTEASGVTTITYKNVPEKACQAIAQKFISNQIFSKIAAGGTNITDAATASSACITGSGPKEITFDMNS